MKYFEMFTGISGFGKGIEQAYGDSDKYESEKSEQTDCGSGRVGVVDGKGADVLSANHAAFRNGGGARMPECIGFSEIAKTPSAILRYLYPDITNYGDATAIVCDELPDFDFLCGGFPCQSFSIAGKRLGFKDTRGTLFFEIARILREKRPAHLLLENVAGLLSHDDGNTFRVIVSTLVEIGYDVEWTVINSKHHGVPQNRERVFIVGHLRERSCGQVFSFGESDELFDEGSGSGSAENQHSTAITSNYRKGVHSGGETYAVGTLRTHKDGEGFREMQSNVSPSLNARARQDGSQQPVIITAPNGKAIDLSSIPDEPCQLLEVRTELGKASRRQIRQSEGRDSTLRGREDKKYIPKTDGLANCLTTQKEAIEKWTITDSRIRRLTPVECARLQGFSDDHADFGINEKGETYKIRDTGKYQCFGNAITVNVVEAIIRKMIEKGCLK